MTNVAKTLGLSKDEFLNEMQSRQETLIGQEACMKLRQACVGIGGLGGIGAFTLEMLVRGGVGRFRLLDSDLYDISNLNRQVFATVETVGRPKAEVAAERINLINPYAKVEKIFIEKANEGNIEELLEGTDIGIVCTDTPSSQIFFHKVARKKHLPLVFAFTVKLGGIAWLVEYADQRRKPLGTRFLYRLYRLIMGQTDWSELSEQEILALDTSFQASGKFSASIGFGSNTAACLQAALAIKYLVGLGKKSPKIQFDFFDMTMSTPSKYSLAPIFSSLRKRFR